MSYVCTVCGKEFDYPPALSRTDNKSFCCRPCGARQALSVAGVSGEDQEKIVAVITEHEND